MLQINLSTRPFYNERAVHLALGLVGILVLALTTFNVTQVVTLSGRHTALTTRADRVEATADDVARQTLTIQRNLDRDELEVADANVRAANTLIDQRVFSWTEFFNRIESTLPADVMLTSVRPEIEPDEMAVSMGVLGRRVEEIETFIEQLEATGAFVELLPLTEEPTNEGLYRAALRGRYLQSAEQAPRGPNAGRTEDPSRP